MECNYVCAPEMSPYHPPDFVTAKPIPTFEHSAINSHFRLSTKATTFFTSSVLSCSNPAYCCHSKEMAFDKKHELAPTNNSSTGRRTRPPPWCRWTSKNCGWSTFHSNHCPSFILAIQKAAYLYLTFNKYFSAYQDIPLIMELLTISVVNRLRLRSRSSVPSRHLTSRHFRVYQCACRAMKSNMLVTCFLRLR